ncbi:MAG: BolA family protein [uncultured bacterium]|nr:MAG: BolA family protein [uncultured bacterium]
MLKYPSERITIIKERLQQHFSPIMLEVIDDSEKHRGHPGALSGAGHYTVIIQAECFAEQSRVAAHQAIYRVLNDLIPDEIHALQIKILPAVS